MKHMQLGDRNSVRAGKHGVCQCGHREERHGQSGCVAGFNTPRECPCPKYQPKPKRAKFARWSMEWSSAPSLCYFDGNVTHHLWVDQYLAFAKDTSATTPLWNALVRALNAARVTLPGRKGRV